MMNDNKKLQLREREVPPTDEVLEQVLGGSYIAYETFQKSLPDIDIEQEWQWYIPYKAWFARGQHRWTTPRGVIKEKNLYWLHVFEGYFSVAIWFKEKNRMEALNANVSEKTKHMILDAKTMGNVPTFPVVFDITTPELFSDICERINHKKRIEK
jgi:hypothetical protein